MNIVFKRFLKIIVVFLLLVLGIQLSSVDQPRLSHLGASDQAPNLPLLGRQPELGDLPGQAGLPLDFIPNRGQWDPAVKFVARKNGLSATFERDSIQLQLGIEQPTVLGLTFEGASPAVLLGEEKRSTAYNFFMGND